jgi:hypothetical protein
MRKAALAVTLILALLLVVVASPFRMLASANPVPWPSTPILDKPSLTIESPTNNTAYENGELRINFTETDPDSWKREGEMMIPSSFARIASVNASLDGNTVYSSTYSPDVNYSAVEVWYDCANHFSIPQHSSPGPHILNVTVLSYSYYRGPAYNGSHILSDITSSSGSVYQYPLVVSDIVYFTITGEPSPSPTSKQTLSIDPNFSFYTGLALLSIVVAVAAAVLLVYFKKRNGGKTPREEQR